MSLVLFARHGAIRINVMPDDETTWQYIFPRMAIANYGHSIIVFSPCLPNGMQISHAFALLIFQCAHALLACSKAQCMLAKVSIRSHLDVIVQDKEDINLYINHAYDTIST